MWGARGWRASEGSEECRRGEQRRARGERGGAVRDELAELRLEDGRHALQDVSLHALLVGGDGGEGGHRRDQLLAEAELLHLEVLVGLELLKLVLQHEVHLAFGGVLLGLVMQPPRLRYGLAKRREPCRRRGRASVRTTDGGGGSNGKDGARAHAAEARRVADVGGERVFEHLHDLLELGLEQVAVVDDLARAAERRALQPRLVERLPDRAAAPAVGAAEEKDLKVALRMRAQGGRIAVVSVSVAHTHYGPRSEGEKGRRHSRTW